VAEKEDIFSSAIKYNGIFSFADFYKFCYDWLTEEAGLSVSEGKYAEKLSGDVKNIDIEWSGSKKASDYIKFEVKVGFKVSGLSNVEVVKEGVKIKTNKGSVEVKVKGTIVKDYQGKFERSPFMKFLRSIYDKYVIPSTIEHFEDKLASMCDEFLSQAKAYLDLEGRK